MTFTDLHGAWRCFYHVTERLGVEQLSIDASHSPFLPRPAELAELLVHATTTKPVGSLQPE